MRTGIPIRRFLVQVLEGAGPLLLYLQRHRVWKVALEHLGGIDHTPEMVRFDPVEKVLETEDVPLPRSGGLARHKIEYIFYFRSIGGSAGRTGGARVDTSRQASDLGRD
jgi:hypothetical protein